MSALEHVQLRQVLLYCDHQNDSHLDAHADDLNNETKDGANYLKLLNAVNKELRAKMIPVE